MSRAEALEALGRHEDQVWREQKLRRLVGPTRRVLERTALAAANQYTRPSMQNRVANTVIRNGVAELLILPRLQAGANESAIKDAAEKKAEVFLDSYRKLLAKNKDHIEVLRLLVAAAERLKLPWVSFAPMHNVLRDDTPDDEKVKAQLARLKCVRWWRRQLRRSCSRTLENFVRRHGGVSKRTGAYISSFALRGYEKRKSETWDLLSAMVAISDMGDKISLADVALTGQANPRNRATELIVRMRGYDEVASSLGLQGVFLTLTTPSRFHACLAKSGDINPRYDGSSPTAAQEWLKIVWANIRAAWNNAGIRTFGFRVAEPHHDGTPHWHLLLHFRPDQVDLAWSIFRAQALKDSPSEPGAQKHRTTLVMIDPKKGTGAGYVAKYIAKNVLGEGLGPEGDLEAETDGREGTRRVSAWASLWGIRQFQQIGCVSVTVYRELRRLAGGIQGKSAAELEALRKAADRGDWAEFVNLMGGPFVARKKARVQAWEVSKLAPGIYGDTVKRLRGVVMRASNYVKYQVTREKNWRIEYVVPDFSTGPPRRGGPLDLCQ